MNKNKSLGIALFIGNSLSVIFLSAIVLLTLILIHWHIDREFYSKIPIGVLNFNTHINFTITKTSVVSSLNSENVEVPATLNNIGYFSLYLIYSQFIASLILMFVLTREFVKIINSVQKVQTFISGNTHSFKKISHYLVVIFFLSSIQMISYDHSVFYGFYLHTEPLILALLSYSLSEIFKEGNTLFEENNATI